MPSGHLSAFDDISEGSVGWGREKLSLAFLFWDGWVKAPSKCILFHVRIGNETNLKIVMNIKYHTFAVERVRVSGHFGILWT